MTTSEPFPPLDYELSPYTGWTRLHWEALLARLTYGYVLAAERSGSPARALYPNDMRSLPDSVDALESFARIAPAWAAWLHNPSNPAFLSYAGRQIDLVSLLRQALIDGTNPDNPHTYWGEMDHFSQHIVEAADLAVTVWLSRERVFNTLDLAQQAQVMAWLAKVDGKQTYFDNWILFPAMSLMVRMKMGFPASVSDLDSRLEQIAAFYRGDGWYVDGPGDEYELYNAWMFGWHYLLGAWIDGDRRPEYRQQMLNRARSFLAGFPYFFGANGSYPAWGRSIVYRFSAIAAFATGYLLGVAPPDPGLLRRISSGSIRYFYENGFIEPEEHYIYQGYHGFFPFSGESYISPGSVYWACHGLFALIFDREDPFWTATEAPLPVERADFDLALPAPGFVLSGRRSTGQVFLLNSRSGQADEILPDAGSSTPSSQAELAIRYGPRHDYPSKYGKLAYSTHFPFNVAPVPGSYAPDAMLALSQDGRQFGHRSATTRSGAAPGAMWSEFYEKVAGQDQLVRIAVLLWKDLQVRLAWIWPTLPLRAYEAPGALACESPVKITRRSDPIAGWEYAEAEGRALAICRLVGYDVQRPSAPFLGYSNINLAYRYSELPLICESWASPSPRPLASLSLLRPSGFEPADEFASITARPQSEGTFQVTLPEGEIAFVDLREDPLNSTQLGEHTIEGNGMRIVRLKRDGSRLCALNLHHAAGIVDLEAPGILELRRDAPEEVNVTTDTGLAFCAAWLGGVIRKLEVQNIQGEWIDTSRRSDDLSIPGGLVREWSVRNERSLVCFRISL
jgi:hypothetical protein